MELFFLAILVITMATALGSGFPVAFALPGSAIITIILAGISGFIFSGDPSAFFHQGGPFQWISSGVTNLRGVYWEVERDTLIAIPLFIFMGIMLQKSKIAEDLLVTMANLFGPVPGGLGISVVFVGALLAATTGIVGATVVAMGLISLPAMLRNNYSQSLATGTIAASGTLGQIIPPSIVLIILADQLGSAADQAGSARKSLFKEATGEISMPSMFDVGSTSAGEMFLGALVPGLILVGLYMVFILVYALIRPKVAPAVRYEGNLDIKFWVNVLLTLVPPLGLIFLVLGSIITGIATVNQAGAIGAGGALIMAGYRLTEGSKGRYYPAILAIISLLIISYCLSNFDMNVKAVIATGANKTGIWIGLFGSILLILSLIWSGVRVLNLNNTMHEVMLETAKTTSLVFIILLGAAVLTAAFRAFGGEELVRNFLNSMPGGFWAKFVIVMAVIFILGFFLDFIEIAVVVVPIVAPILLADPAANITAVWLGVMIGLNIQTSFLTPPFGFALFYLRGVAPIAVKTVSIYKGVIAFICLQLLALAIVGYYPQMVNYLPNRMSFLSDASPPPRNPKLQICLEEFVTKEINQNEKQIFKTIDVANEMELNFLPKKHKNNLASAFKSAELAINSLDDIKTTSQNVIEKSNQYRPQLTHVRRLESEIRWYEKEIKELKSSLNYLKSAADQNKRIQVENKIISAQNIVANIKSKIPENWEATYKAFNKLTKAETNARRKYRKAADQSFSPVADFILILDANDSYFNAKDELITLKDKILTAELSSQDAELFTKNLKTKFSKITGATKIASSLRKVQKNLKPGKVNVTKALIAYEKTFGLYEEQSIWRLEAENKIKTELQVYLNGISDTLGARQAAKLSRAQALYLAKCNSGHRDLSLNF